MIQAFGETMKRSIEHWKVITFFLIIYDYIAVLGSYFMALLIRFDLKYSMIDQRYVNGYIGSIFYYAMFVIVIFQLFKLYKSIWRFASYSELMRVAASTVITGIAYSTVMAFTCRMPVSYFLFGIVFQFMLTLGVRFSYRFVLLLHGRRNENVKKTNVMLIGAGNAGQMVFRDIKSSRETNDTVKCFIDDNPNKWGRYIDGVPVYGGRDVIFEAVQKFSIEKIYITIPAASPEDKRNIISICNETDCDILSLPGMYQLYTGEVTVSQMKPVKIEDLLGRDPIRIDTDEVFKYITNKTVLVTGVGSIGSELSRQIAAHHPKRLVLFDVYENNAYDIQQELKRKFPELNLNVIIGSVRDSRKIYQVFDEYKPDIVYHAAAHKHVPLMEDSPCESIKNNVIGTYKTAYAAMVHGTKRFVLISTDKAVNPTNIMGASKRLCEMIIQSFDHKIKEGKANEIPQLFTHSMDDGKNENDLSDVHTEFVAVRFGNVLGSNGSVIPLFKKQIEQGGPVTVTHPDIIRYFMTIPEAVSLVLLAGTFAKGGEIFVLDMGEPVKIDTLARNLIRLSGFKPDIDIKIEYSGLRPGEKLYEEKLMAEEGLKKTKNDLIHIGCPIPFDTDVFLNELQKLMEEAYRNSNDIREKVRNIVTTYHPM